jgi:xanthine dehydrogenase iron-sulfur cluster and FAD-binding subunit A
VKIVDAISGNICRCTGLRADRGSHRARRRAYARRQSAGGTAQMSEAGRHRYVSSDRRVREDRRFVAGKGNSSPMSIFRTLSTALVTCPYAAAHHIGRQARRARHARRSLCPGRA